MGRIAVELSDQVIITSDNPRTEDPDQIIGHTNVPYNNEATVLCLTADH